VIHRLPGRWITGTKNLTKRLSADDVAISIPGPHRVSAEEP
jgi:hypothetical protein